MQLRGTGNGERGAGSGERGTRGTGGTQRKGIGAYIIGHVYVCDII